MLNAHTGEIAGFDLGEGNEVAALFELVKRGGNGKGIVRAPDYVRDMSRAEVIAPRVRAGHRRGIDFERVGRVAVKIGNLKVVGVT